ncbi:MAG TPA: hypothetical protein VJV78_17280 [Polyangiales bacterium]|nr:hypothetical protein [Polyangiales bacterium]
MKIENVVASPLSVTPGSPVTVDLDYTIVDARCPGCIDQIQYGWVNVATGAGTPVLGQCIYNGTPGAAGARGHAKVTLAAPSAAGSYAFAFDRAQHFSCAQVTGWWNGTPRPEQRLKTIEVKSTDPLGSITGLPLHSIGAGVRGATVSTTPLGKYVQLRYSVPAQPFDTERDYTDGPGGWNNVYGTGRPFFNVTDGQRFGVVWQARNATTVYVTWFGADPAAAPETVILPLPSDAILAAATSDGAGNLYAFAIQGGDGRPNSTRVGTLLKTNARGAQLARSQPDMSASGLNVASFVTGAGSFTWVADMQFSNGKLGLMFGRLMHQSSDTLNHQGGIAVVFDAQTLAVSANLQQTSGHSWDNVLTRDAQGNFLGIDLGDNYPRGLNLHRFNASGRTSRVVYTFKTLHGTTPSYGPGQPTYPRYDEISDATHTYYRWSNDNNTYTELGGVIDTAQGIVAVFAGERPSLDNRRVGALLNDARNLAMVTVRRDFSNAQLPSVPDDQVLFPGNVETSSYYTFNGTQTAQRNTGVRWLTNYTSTAQNASRVKLHPLNTTDALIMWELWGANNYQNTYAMSVRPDGTVTQQAVELGTMFRLNRRDDIFDHNGRIYSVAGDGANRELILNILVR